MDIQERRAVIIRQYIEAYNRFDVTGMLRDLHNDIVFQNISGGHTDLTLSGKEEFRQQAEKASLFFKNREQQITGFSIDNNIAEVAIHYTGTLAADLPNGLKEGAEITVEGKSVFEFLEDKIIRLTDIS